MHVRAAAWFLLLIGTAGCAVPGRPDVDGARFVALTVTAPSASVTVINAEPQTLPYRAAGTTPAGEVVDVSDVVTWSVSDDLGTFAAAVLNVPGTAAGAGIVTARLDDLVATADLEVFATHRRVDPGLPDDIVARFDTSTRHPDRHLELAYPPADVVVPPNLATLPIHWHRQADRAFYRLRVSSPYRRVERFLPATPNDNEIVPVPWDEWAFVTDDARDGEVWFDVAGLALDSGALVESEVRRVRVAAADLEGALYFFSVDEAAELSSLRRLDVGRPDAVAETFLDGSQVGGTCVGCHAVSRDGRSVAVVLDVPRGQGAVLDLASFTPTLLDPTVRTTYAAFSPAGDRLVATRTTGELSVVDVGSGQVIAEVDTGGHLATQPDWSPDGTQIVWTSYEVEGPAQLMQFHGGGDLWVTPIDPVTLVSGRPFRVLDLTPPARAAYPSYSPDGTWLLYNRSDEDSYDDYTARVWTVRSDGRGDPVDLGAASFDGSSPLSGPRWAPFGNTADGGEPIWWFTASTREPIGVGPWTFDPQLWMGAFFPGRPGARATSPLWHIPNQGDAHNHFGQWTTTLVEID